MKRNPAIELFRVLLMFGICLLHVQTAAGGGRLTSVLVSCVPGFVMISGWFGIHFSWRKIFMLYGVAVYASLVIPLVGVSGRHRHIGVRRYACGMFGWILSRRADSGSCTHTR